MRYNLDWNVTNIARLPTNLLFLPARMCCADKIQRISAQRNDSMQYSLRVALL